jgi:hypothetical protein
MAMVIKSKQFDGSNACITFIREASMERRESAPHVFKKTLDGVIAIYFILSIVNKLAL